VVPWIETLIDASGCQNADEVYDKLRTTLGALVLQAKERVTAVRLKLSGATDAHTELNRDPDQGKHPMNTVSVVSFRQP
jgi:hypothetical protein